MKIQIDIKKVYINQDKYMQIYIILIFKKYLLMFPNTYR
jgi:hypothetical protein